MSRLLAACLAVLVGTGLVHAYSSDWVETPGAAMRLHLTPTNEQDGQISGVLDVRLDEGWKTYWREPGDGGIPPSLTLTVNGQATPIAITYPVPHHLEAGGSRFAGYETGASFLFTIAHDAASAQPMAINAFIGICSDVCVPFAADFAVDPSVIKSGGPAALALAMAKTRLPQPVSADDMFSAIRWSASELVLDVAGESPPRDLFLAHGAGLAFGRPEIEGQRIVVPVFEDSSQSENAQEIPFVLQLEGRAVEGALVPQF